MTGFWYDTPNYFMNDPSIKLTIDKRSIATLTLNRPELHNAVSLEMIRKMRKIIEELNEKNNKDEDDNNTMEDIELYDFDHIYDNDEISSNINRVRVILYGVVGETDFNNFHEKLLSYATAGNIEYIVRHGTNNYNAIKFWY